MRIIQRYFKEYGELRLSKWAMARIVVALLIARVTVDELPGFMVELVVIGAPIAEALRYVKHARKG